MQKTFFRSTGFSLQANRKKDNSKLRQCEAKFKQRRRLEFWNEDNSSYDLEKTPVATITDIPQYVTVLLDQYDKENQLTYHNSTILWHDSTIPDDEVWVKLGGDHGRATFKLMLQTANLTRPNSKHNTCLLATAQCKDTPPNLRWITGPYKQQITELETMQWRDKTSVFSGLLIKNFSCNALDCQGHRQTIRAYFVQHPGHRFRHHRSLMRVTSL